jgi:DNA-binding LacI/PurR family transcriptional regulator
MRDVAEHAGVSVRTVSNVVSGYAHVSAATRAKVQRSLDELGYRMDYLARGLRSGRTGFVALAVPFLAEPYFAELAQAVIRAAARRGITVLVESTGGDSEVERRILSGGLTNVADGVLLSALTVPSDAAPDPDFPLVLLGEHGVGDRFPRVGIDNVAAARTAVEHLLEQGCRRIVALGRNGSENGRQRTEGYRRAMDAARVRRVNRLEVPVDDWTRRHGYEAVRELLDGEDDGLLPDAIFAFNDALAIGALRALDAAGVRVPGQVAVASIDDVQDAAYTHPPLTSIAPDLDVIAERALSLLDEQAGADPAASTDPGAGAAQADAEGDAGPSPRHQQPAPFRLVVRESSRRR